MPLTVDYLNRASLAPEKGLLDEQVDSFFIPGNLFLCFFSFTYAPIEIISKYLLVVPSVMQSHGTCLRFISTKDLANFTSLHCLNLLVQKSLGVFEFFFCSVENYQGSSY